MCLSLKTNGILTEARLAQSAERKALNLVVVGSSPTVGVLTGCVTKRAYLRSTRPHWRKVDIIAGVSLKKLCVASQWYVAILQRPIYVTTLSSVCLKQHMRNGRWSCSCCGHISWQYSRTSCSVSERTFSTRSLTMLRSFWACPRLFCGNQDLRSLIVAMLQYSMPSVMTVLLKISKSSMLSKYCALNLEQWLWTLLQTPQAL